MGDLKDSKGIRLKRFIVSIAGNDLRPDDVIDKINEKILSDDRMVECVCVFDRIDERMVYYIEYDHSKKVSAFINQFKGVFDVNFMIVKKLKCEKKILIQAMLKVGLNQGEIPFYYCKTQTGLSEFF